MLRFFHDTVEGVRMAMGALRANPLRSALTMLGIIIGIVTVTLMSAFLTGLTEMFHETTSFMGTDVYYINKFSWGGGDWRSQMNRPNVTLEEARELRQRMTTAKAISVNDQKGNIELKYGANELEDLRAVGVDAPYEVTGSIEMDQGRFFATQELESARPVCIIGYDIWDALFHKANPIGKLIRANGYTLEVIGVAKQVGGMFGEFSTDREVLMPLQTFFNAYGQPDPMLTIAIKAKNVLQKEDTRAEADFQMRIIRRLKPTEKDNFGVNSEDQFNQIFDGLTSGLTIVGLTITGLSLLVGGIGIMNIMFVGVKERTREIGIRKAVGARRRMVLAQFLAEATMLTLVAGSIGLLLAYAASLYINAKVLTADSSVHLHFTLVLILSGLAISLGIGVASGIVPAWRASKLDPVEALRYE
ncbi:MAG TPA: ABC transporter permease [Candidatus Kapabacteria bacterium]|nr:ABC transporter permease [Candidatus Kapabacteria bacterium]